MLMSVNGHHYITYFYVHLVLNDVVAMKDLNAIRKKGKGKKLLHSCPRASTSRIMV